VACALVHHGLSNLRPNTRSQGNAHSRNMHPTDLKVRTPTRTASAHLVWRACGPISALNSRGPVPLLLLCWQGGEDGHTQHHPGLLWQARVSAALSPAPCAPGVVSTAGAGKGPRREPLLALW
jgi:hypothetical protein